jgi:uncharacterized protein (TIGR00369 family)
VVSRDEIIAFLDAQHRHTVLHTLGVRIESHEPACVAVDIDERLFQHAGIVHGGVYVLLAESAASMAAAFAVDVTTHRIAGQEISASHIRASSSGTLRATATPVHVGRTSLVYAIDVTCDGKLVSVCRCTVAVRPLAA